MTLQRLLTKIVLWGSVPLIPHTICADPSASSSPKQSLIPNETIRVLDAQLQTRASYEAKLRIFSTQTYDDPISNHCPMDLAVGWGNFLDLQHFEKIHVSQSDRHYTWSYWGKRWAPAFIHEHSANLHIIPASNALREKLSQLKKAQLISVKGRLVDVSHPVLHEVWKTSLSRKDTGTGACEILWLEELSILQEEEK